MLSGGKSVLLSVVSGVIPSPMAKNVYAMASTSTEKEMVVYLRSALRSIEEHMRSRAPNPLPGAHESSELLFLSICVVESPEQHFPLDACQKLSERIYKNLDAQDNKPRYVIAEIKRFLEARLS